MKSVSYEIRYLINKSIQDPVLYNQTVVGFGLLRFAIELPIRVRVLHRLLDPVTNNGFSQIFNISVNDIPIDRYIVPRNYKRELVEKEILNMETVKVVINDRIVRRIIIVPEPEQNISTVRIITN